MKFKINFLLLVISFTLAGCGAMTAVKTTPKATQKKTNTLPIPTACEDKTKKYKPTKTINSRTNYLEKNYAYKPILSENGIIEYDFNKDRKLDVVFIEKRAVKKQTYNKKNPTIRLVICESRGRGYQRRYPVFTIFENMSPDYQAGSQRIELKADNLVLTRNNHEHNWGSDSEISTYRYSTALKDFELMRRETVSSSGDGYRSDTHNIYFLPTLRFIERNTCGASEEGCKSGARIGRIIPLAEKPTLYKDKQRKFYKKLIRDK